MNYKPTHYFYWDSCVFISWLEQEPGRVHIIKELLKQTVEKQGKILTCAISIVEVAYIAQEKQEGVLDSAAEKRIDDLWTDPAIQIVETSQYLMKRARHLMRQALSSGWKLKPPDAIHLATAEWVQKRSPTRVNEFHTYDKGLEKYKTAIGIDICKPHVDHIQTSLLDDN